METPEILAVGGGIVSLVISVSTFVKGHFISKATADKDFNRAQLDAQRASELSKIFLEYERRFSRLETQAELFYTVIQKDVGNMIHSPHRPELDRLIEMNNDPHIELTRNDAIRIVQLLDEIIEVEKPSRDERFGITVYKASIISQYGLKELVAI